MKSKFCQDTAERMKKTIESVRSEFSHIRTGKATTALLDGIRVEYYNNLVPLKQVANVTAPDMRTLAIQPWEKNMIVEIEKAILKSDLGLNPVNDGRIIRIPIPVLTEERRKDLVKVIKKLAEDGRIAIRNIRRDVNEIIKKAEKNHELSEDSSHDELNDIQELTNDYIKNIDDMLKIKEEEIMEV